MVLLSTVIFQMKALNESLDEKLVRNAQKIDGKWPAKAIRKASILYIDFCDGLDEISKFYAISTLSFFGAYFFFCFFTNYIAFVFFLTPSLPLYIFLCYFSTWLLIFIPFILCLLLSSTFIANEATKTAELLIKLHAKSTNIQVAREIAAFNLHFEHRKAKISCGFFEVNWKSYFQIIGLIISFSVILLQFYDVEVQKV
jgi:hypothetical protein